MNARTDFETIDEFNRLKDTVQQLLTKSKELQREASLVESQIENINDIQRSVKSLGGYKEMQELFENLKIAQGPLILFRDRYNQFAGAIEEILGIVNNFKSSLSTVTSASRKEDFNAQNLEPSAFSGTEDQVAQSFVDSLAKLGLAVESTSVFDAIASINAKRQELLEQQQILVEKLSSANNYSDEFQVVQVNINSIYKRVQEVSISTEFYLAEVAQTKAAIQANAGQVATASDSVQEIKDQLEGHLKTASQISTDVREIREHIDAQRDATDKQIEILDRKFSSSKQQSEQITFKIEEAKKYTQTLSKYFNQTENLQTNLKTLSGRVEEHHNDYQELLKTFFSTKEAVDKALKQGESLRDLVLELDAKHQRADAVYQSILSIAQSLGGQQLIERFNQELQANMRREKSINSTLQEAARLRNESENLHSKTKEKIDDWQTLVDCQSSRISRIETLLDEEAARLRDENMNLHSKATGQIHNLQTLIDYQESKISEIEDLLFDEMAASKLKVELARRCNTRITVGAILLTCAASLILGAWWSTQCKSSRQLLCQPVFWLRSEVNLKN